MDIIYREGIEITVKLGMQKIEHVRFNDQNARTCEVYKQMKIISNDEEQTCPIFFNIKNLDGCVQTSEK